MQLTFPCILYSITLWPSVKRFVILFLCGLLRGRTSTGTHDGKAIITGRTTWTYLCCHLFTASVLCTFAIFLNLSFLIFYFLVTCVSFLWLHNYASYHVPSLFTIILARAHEIEARQLDETWTKDTPVKTWGDAGWSYRPLAQDVH